MSKRHAISFLLNALALAWMIICGAFPDEFVAPFLMPASMVIGGHPWQRIRVCATAPVKLDKPMIHSQNDQAVCVGRACFVCT
jgi:hypothetical protein